MLCKLFSQFLEKLQKIMARYFRFSMLVIYLMRLLYIFELVWSNLLLKCDYGTFCFRLIIAVDGQNWRKCFLSRTRILIMVDKKNKYSAALSKDLNQKSIITVERFLFPHAKVFSIFNGEGSVNLIIKSTGSEKNRLRQCFILIKTFVISLDTLTLMIILLTDVCFIHSSINNVVVCVKFVRS